MKKIFFVAISATLLAAGCQKTEVINPVGEPALGFTTGAKKLTKSVGTADAAATDKDQNLKAQDFRVWAYAAEEFDHTQSTDVNLIYDGMENLPVTFTSEGGWGTTSQHFWPGKEKELKFFAVSGDNNFFGTGGTTSTTVIPSPSENTMQVKDFTITSPNYNVDLMVADYAEQNQYKKAVDLNFRHTLSKVEFVFNTRPAEGISVFVQKVEVAGLVNKGTLDVKYDEMTEQSGSSTDDYKPATGKATFKWNHGVTEPTKGDFIDDWETEIPTTNTNFPSKIEGIDVTADDRKAMEITAAVGTEDPANVFTTWLMIPQSIEGKKVKITYLLNERKAEGEFALDVNNLKEWKDNQYIRYVVTLSPNLISFNASTTDWTTVSDSSHEN